MAEHEPLYTKHRPKSFDDVVGQDAAVKSLRSLCDGNTHAFLLTGPSGTGKTTLARIAASHLDAELQEIDAATYTGIDDMRQVADSLRYKPFGGKQRKAVLVDECFAPGTLVDTPSGSVPIESVHAGDWVTSLDGLSPVRKQFRNCVPLDRVARVTLSDGSVLFCSVDHQLFTDAGWVEARKCCGREVLSREKLRSLQLRTGLQEVWRKLPFEGAEQTLLSYMRDKNLPCMWGGVSVKNQNLLHCLRQSSSRPDEIWSETGVLERSCTTRAGTFERTKTPNVGESKESTLDKNAEQQPFKEARLCGKDEEYEVGTRGVEHLASSSWWERAAYSTSEEAGLCSGGGNGVSCTYGGWSGERLPSCVQSRHCLTVVDVGDRDRWERTQTSRSGGKGQQEGQEADRVRVDRVEVYKRGRNDERFLGVVGNRDLQRGYVEFYDLEVDGHPSYFAEGIAVHNCHSLSKQAWQSLLKALEEPPEHAYWFLCTTEPGKVQETIRTRCAAYDLRPVDGDTLFTLLGDVDEMEKLGTSDDVLDLIASSAEGSPRKALVYLEQCRGVQDRKEAAELIKAAGDQKEVIDLCRWLAAGQGLTWAKAVQHVKPLSEMNAESIRLTVVNYFTNVALGTNKQAKAQWALLILDAFSEPCNQSEKMAPILRSLGEIIFAE